MDNGIYITLSRQLNLFRDMQVTANNIANTNTGGYNAEHILFNSYLTKDINQGVKNPMSFAYNVNTYLNTAQGDMRATGNELDVAIQGTGYFMVETPLGERYTRSGNFQMDGEGTLITAQGYPVLDANGQRITIPEGTNEIKIGEAGNIKVNGEEFSTLGVAEFENPQLLERLDNQLFKSDLPPQLAQNARVAQGVLEYSNVQPVIEMTHMIDVSRKVESTAKFIEVMYDLQRKTSSTYAKQS